MGKKKSKGAPVAAIRKLRKKKPEASPAHIVRKLIKAGTVKKKCCRSQDRCRRCPVLALKHAKAELTNAA